MYRHVDPGDCTTVVKMCKDLNSFLEKSPTSTSTSSKIGSTSMFTLGEQEDDSYLNFDFMSSSNRSRRSLQPTSNRNTADRSSMDRTAETSDERTARKRRQMTTLSVDEKAELIAAKSKAAKLEVQLKSTESEKQRFDIEAEKKRKLRAEKVAKDQEEIDVLRRSYKQIVGDNETLKEKVAELENAHKELKAESDARISGLEKENSLVKNQLEDLQCDMDDEFDEMKRSSMNDAQENIVYKQQLEQTQRELQMSQQSLREMRDVVQEFNDVQSRCHLAEGKVKQLEQKLLQKDETYEIVAKSQEQLVNYQSLEKENKALREDNKLYRDSQSNYLILEEKYNTLTRKLAKADTCRERVEQLEYENEKLLEKISKWEAPDVEGLVRARSPQNLTRIIGELQSTQLDLTGKNTQLRTKASLTETMLENKSEECYSLLKQFREASEKSDQLEDDNQKLRRRQTLLKTERDGLRHVLSSYENDENDNNGAASRIHLQQAEEKVQLYNEQLKTLETQLAAVKKESAAKETKFCFLEQEYKKLKASQEISEDKIQSSIETEGLRKQLTELQQQHELVVEEKEVLELRIEKRELQGDYDPRKTKVLKLRNNPYERATEAYMKKMQDVEEDNTKMRKKIIQLQTQQKEELEESMNVSRLIKSSKPMEEMQNQVAEWQRKYKRLEEGFMKNAKCMMTAVTNLLGYKLKQEKENTFRLTSVYVKNPSENFFMLRCEVKKDLSIETAVIQTQFLTEWMHLYEEYITQSCSEDPIPAFLAAVSLELHHASIEG